MSKKMVSCRTCGADIAKNAKVCPSCGAKNKKPIYKRWRLWAIVLVLVIGMFGGSGEEGQVEASTPSASTPSQPEPAPSAPVEPTPEPVIEYTEYTVKQLVEDLKSNALKAEQTYDGQYVELTGELQVIDSDGKYISLIPNGEFTIDGVQCYIKGDVQKAAVLGMTVGDTVVVRGKITDIGEILGYTLAVDEFVKK